MSSSEQPGEWQGPETGHWYETTKFHWFKREVVVCPACDCRPCEPDCPEQVCANPRPAVGADEEPAAAPVLIGDGNPQHLVAAAFAEAKRRKEEATA